MNPSSFLYQSADSTDYRLNPQNEPTSLIVRIRQQYNGPDQNEQGDPRMLVDFLSAPFDSLLGPAPGTYAPNTMISVDWDTAYSDVINAVDIDYSRFGGTSWTRLVTGHLVTPGTPTFDVQLDPSMAGAECTFRVTYHNSLSQYTATSELPWTFTVSGDAYKAEDILEPTPESAAFTGESATVTWTDHYWQDTSSVRLHVLAPGWQGDFEVRDFDSPIVHDAQTQRSTATWRPQPEDIRPDMRVFLEFVLTDGDTTYSVPTAAFPVYPLGATFEDSTTTAVDPGDWYTCTPYSVVGRDLVSPKRPAGWPG